VRFSGQIKERLIASFADPESQRIVLAVLARPKTSVEMEKELSLPPSTLYRKISELKECGLLMVEKFAIRQDGRREAVYACPFVEIRFKVEKGNIELDLIQTEESVAKRWFELFFSKNDLRQIEPLLPASGSSSSALSDRRRLELKQLTISWLHLPQSYCSPFVHRSIVQMPCRSG
jgi:predicted transcriptional regulator